LAWCVHRWPNIRSRGALGSASIEGGQQEGCQIFVDALRQFAEQSRNPRLTPIIRRIAAPLRVAVRGRDGVGRATVASALSASGVVLTPDESAADINVVVIAEALKPEDRVSTKPSLIVLNKADLTEFGAGGPLALAHRRAAHYRALTGVPVVPMIGLLATAELDEELIGALSTLVREPADLTSTDAFVDSEHVLTQQVRRRLLDTLDRFGIAHAVLAIGDGADAAEVHARLRRLSLVDRVAAHLEAAGAPLRYRRVRSVIAELQALAAQSGDDRLSGLLAADDTVLAVMAAAVEVVEAEGVRVDRGDDPAAHLRRAVHWRRYGRGPVDDLHRSCAADICRGSLRLLGRSR
jgi:hypothetical protein